MTREEFENHCTAIQPNFEKWPTVQQYAAIEYVYNFHPSISEVNGKTQIARLYVEFGMAIINDMQERAMAMEKAEKDLRAAKEQVAKVEHHIEMLRIGGAV